MKSEKCTVALVFFNISLIHGAAIGAASALAQGLSTASAAVVAAGKAAVSPQSEGHIGQQQQIAYVVERQDAEHHVEHGTDGPQSAEVQQCIGSRQAASSSS